MQIFSQILIGIVAIICFLGGINLLRKGAMYFLPKSMSSQPVLDNLIRFLSGIYFGCGFLFAYAAWNYSILGKIPYLLGMIVFFSGLGRVISRVKVGSAGKYFDSITLVELLIGSFIVLLHYLQ